VWWDGSIAVKINTNVVGHILATRASSTPAANASAGFATSTTTSSSSVGGVRSDFAKTILHTRSSPLLSKHA
jgi:hypothetical protein